MATIIERRKKVEKEQRRFERKLLALQAECLHPDGMITEVCPDCLWGGGAVQEPDLDPFMGNEWAGGVQ